MSRNRGKTNYYSSLTGLRRAVPIILCALGAFLGFCYFTAATGVVGGAIVDFLRGLFAGGAYAVAPLLILHGVFYPSDTAKKRVVSRVIFSLVAILCIAVISYAVFHIKAGDIKPGFMPEKYYSMGIDGKGGGVVGSILAYGIIKIFGSVGLIIITSAVFAIYVAYFFTDGHGVVGKVCLAVISAFANIGAFIERKIKALFSKIKNAQSEKDKRISVEKSRDLSDDEFFMVDNGLEDLAIPDLGIKEIKSADEAEEAPVLHEKVRLKSAVDEQPARRGALDDVRIIEAPQTAYGETASEKPKKRKILHTDFDLGETVLQDADRGDDIIYDDPPKVFAAHEDSAESVFTRNFDPFDISASEKLASKPSSKHSASVYAKKESPKFTEDISNITEEDVARARRQAEFEIKKRTIMESYTQAEEEKQERASAILGTSAPEEIIFAAPTAPEAPKKAEQDAVSYMSEEPSVKEEAAASSPVFESVAYEPEVENEESLYGAFAAEERADDEITASEKLDAEPVEESFERHSHFSDVITEYAASSASSCGTEIKIEEYKAPYTDEGESFAEDVTPARPQEPDASYPEIQTITLEHERVAPAPDDIFAEEYSSEEFLTEEPFALGSPEEDEEDGEDISDGQLLSDGEDEDGDAAEEIVPEEERNPLISEYRSMFPILDEDGEEEDEEDGGLSFEHGTADFETSTEEQTPEEDEAPPFDTDPAHAERVFEDVKKAPAPPPEPPKPKKPDYSKYKFPPIDLLKPESMGDGDDVNAEIEENANNLIAALEEFKVKASIKGVDRGPRITRYEIVPAAGVKVSTIMNLQDDIQLRLAAEGIRMEAPIPGKSAIGFELPNRKPSIVSLRSLIETDDFKNAKSKTMICIGKDVAGCPIFGDTAKMPHMLIAGATGMGKSVCINSLMISMLYKARPDEVKFIMIDPKTVEFTVYNGIPHLLIPVVTDPKQAAGALMWAVEQMEKRYELISKMRVRNIEMYNEKVANDPSLGEPMPKIVIVIDEFADLMLQVRDPVENLVMSIAQKARAAGIHLIIGTQRPSVDVITGVIKANIPSRIACKVMSNTDSRTILDQKGAEDLLDRGDMLYAPAGRPKPVRVQGAFVSDGEVEEIMEFIKSQGGENNYDSDVMEEITRNAQKCNKKNSDDFDDDDSDGEDSMGFLNDQKFLDAVNVAVTTGKISTSLLQRKLSIGYGKAAKYVDIMEDMGIVSESNGQKAREVLITRDEWHEKLARLSLDD